MPEDGLGFVHVRLAELWSHDSLKDVRKIVKKAGDRAIQALDQRFAGLPSSVERITLWAGPSRSKRNLDCDFVFVVRLSRAVDRGELRKLILPQARERRGSYYSWFEDGIGASLLIADDRTFAIGPKAQIARLAERTPAKANPLREGIAVAASGRPLVVAVNVPLVPADWMKDLREVTPRDLLPALDAQTAIASLDLEGEGHLHLRVRYASERDAESILKMIKAPDGAVRKLIVDTRAELAQMVVGEEKAVGLLQVPMAAAAVMGMGVLKHVEDVIVSDKVQRSGSAIEATIELPRGSKTIIVPAAFAAGAGVAAFASQWRDMMDARAQNDLKQMMLAFHNYHDVNGEMPPAIVDNAGKPLLSWRVALLPYVEQDNLYKQFKLNEPWDSEHNKKLIEPTPKIFQIEGVETKAGYTHYRTFIGAKAPWDVGRPATFARITDGLSNTVIFVQAKEPVIWTKPDELVADGKAEIMAQLLFRDGRTVAGFGDGSARVPTPSAKRSGSS